MNKLYLLIKHLDQLHNKMLKFRQGLYNKALISYSKIDLNNWCNRVLKDDYPWLCDIDKFALTNAIYKNMDMS